MKSTEWFDRARDHLGITSDNALANALGVHRSLISHHRSGRSTALDDGTAYKVAEILGIDAAEIMADQHAEGSDEPAIKKVWEQIAKTISAAALGSIVLYSSPDFTEKTQEIKNVSQQLNSIRHRRRPRIT